jgi:hypothetical protein
MLPQQGVTTDLRETLLFLVLLDEGVEFGTEATAPALHVEPLQIE